MCEQVDGQGQAVESPAGGGAAVEARPGVEAEIVSLWAVVDDLRREIHELRQGQREELNELRMGQRKAVLEELAALERPLVEQGVIAQRTRPPRHRGDET